MVDPWRRAIPKWWRAIFNFFFDCLLISLVFGVWDRDHKYILIKQSFVLNEHTCYFCLHTLLHHICVVQSCRYSWRGCCTGNSNLLPCIWKHMVCVLVEKGRVCRWSNNCRDLSTSVLTEEASYTVCLTVPVWKLAWTRLLGGTSFSSRKCGSTLQYVTHYYPIHSRC